MNISAIILAGGKSSRMGQNKALMKLNNLSLVEHSIKIAKHFTNNILLSTNSNEYELLKITKIADLHKEIGALGGLHACLKYSETEKNIVLACDTPFISEKTIEKLISESKNFDITILKNGDFYEPLLGIYSKKVFQQIEKNISEKKYSLRQLIEKTNYNLVELNLKTENQLININTPADYKKALNLQSKS